MITCYHCCQIEVYRQDLKDQGHPYKGMNTLLFAASFFLLCYKENLIISNKTGTTMPNNFRGNPIDRDAP